MYGHELTQTYIYRYYYGGKSATKSKAYGVEMTDYGNDDDDEVALDFERGAGGGGGRGGRGGGGRGSGGRGDRVADASLDRPTAYTDEPSSRYTDKTPPRSGQDVVGDYYDEEEEEEEADEIFEDDEYIESNKELGVVARNPINFLDVDGAEASL